MKTVYQVIDARLKELKSDYGKNEFNSEHDRLVRIGELEHLIALIEKELQRKAYQAGMKSKQSHTEKLMENTGNV